MLTNFFGKSKPISFLVVFILFFCFYFTTVISGKTDIKHFEIPLLFLLLFAIIIFINIKNNLSFDNLYVFLVFILLVGIFPSLLKINTVFYSNLILLLYLRKIYSLQSPLKSLKKIFDAGLWLGIVFILEPFSIIFGLLIYLSTYLHQHLTFQKVTIPIVGFLIPSFLFFTYCFWFDKIDLFFNLFDWYTYYDLSIYKTTSFLIPISILSFFILLGILLKTPKALSVNNVFRKSWVLVLLNFLCATILLITIKERNGSEFLYLLFPTAVIIANLIEIYEKKWFSDAFIAFLIIFSFTMCII